MNSISIEHRMDIEAALNRKFDAEMSAVYESVPGVFNTRSWGHYCTSHNLPLLCEGCLNNNVVMIRNSNQCSLNCKFCYQHGYNEHYPEGMYKVDGAGYVEADDIKAMFDMHDPMGAKIVRWTSWEPLERTELIYKLSPFFSKRGNWQTMNTNGLHATPEVLSTLKGFGFNEIRFNLAAVGFKPIKDNIKLACDMEFEVGIEMPIFQESYNILLKHMNALLKMEVDFIVMAELQVMPTNIKSYVEEDKLFYRYRGALVSPMSSRRLIADLMTKAVEQKWVDYIPTFMECSNQTKYFRNMRSSSPFTIQGRFSSFDWFSLDWYQWAKEYIRQ